MELELIGRNRDLFTDDMLYHQEHLVNTVQSSAFLIVGGAGSIGQAVAKEIFRRNPKVLHVVDVSENNMVELVRDIRSSQGYGDGEFKTFAIDAGSDEFEALVRKAPKYDYVFNLSALKHVRSEKDPFTLMRLVTVNIFNSIRILRLVKGQGCQNYFCVSTDKAANPVNMMGASKRIMELFLMRESLDMKITMARFANVAFSDGSLLHGFNQRFLKRQPISAPNDVRRYFVSPKEAGELCVMSGLLGSNRDIFFPKLSEELHLTKFSEIAHRYLKNLGYEAVECSSEEEARGRAEFLISKNKWPCFFFSSDTTGEKGFEEFFTDSEEIDFDRFNGIGIIKNPPTFNESSLDAFEEEISSMRRLKDWSKESLIQAFRTVLPELDHRELGRDLDQRM